jgi:hypothetical protein
VGHEVHDELGQCGVERLISKRQLLRRSPLHCDPRVALSSGLDEGLGRVDGRHSRRSQPLDQLRRQRTWTAADIEDSLTGGDRSKIGELRRERD